ncbi:MAG TPA: undecaprenyl-diphosphate phosphatase [Candidatus Paceibacterota bacterium]|jgi:undecaprenyl-diphosphatase|nr:undecaprenyl-diphosphate phosphatase [Candidatus Paceibacterota bacterium]
MLSPFQAVILGLLQGVTELFPISSLGHSILLPGLFGWQISANAANVVEFLVATHFATALVLFFLYWNDWMRIIRGIFRSLVAREVREDDAYAKLGWLLVIGTIPAGIVGLVLKDQVTAIFTSPRSAAFFLILNGILLFAAEFLRRRGRRRKEVAGATDAAGAGADARLAKLTWWQGTKIGFMQILALLPGISRTGSTMTGGLWTDLSHEDALRFAFLLATPIIGAAALLELPGLLAAGGAILQDAVLGAVAAGIAAYFSAKFLVRYFKTNTLIPFAVYCAAIGIIGLLIIR